MAKFKDLTGQKFGNLIVIGQDKVHYTKGGNKVYKWVCECQCENKNIVIASTNELTCRNRHCCIECLRKEYSERMSKMISEKNKQNKKYNTYDLSGDYGIGYTSKGEEFWFDLEDYDKIKDYTWHKHHKYFVAKIIDKNGKRKSIGLHKLIMDDLNNEYDIDHIKTEYKYDNRKLNLRKANRQENNRNSVLYSNNTSGVSGVVWHSRDKIWEASIKVNYKYIYLGRFKNFEDAVQARKEAEQKYFGEYSYDNSQKIYEKRINGGN